MIDWYFHAPGEGRAGPFSADELRKRFQDRVIQRDTLVWYEGLREWQPLERFAAELGISDLQQTGGSALPPPMPSSAPPPMATAYTAARTAARGKYARAPLTQNKKTLSSGAIALIVAGLIAIPGVMIIASIALPAYRDYAQQATRQGSIAGLSNGLKQAIGDYALRTGTCPGNDDAHLGPMRAEIRRRFSMDVRFADIPGGCAFEVAVVPDGKPAEGQWLRYEGVSDGNTFVWDCSGGDMPESYRPYECRAGG